MLDRKRPSSLRMIGRLHDGLRIPYESLPAGVSSFEGHADSGTEGDMTSNWADASRAPVDDRHLVPSHQVAAHRAGCGSAGPTSSAIICRTSA